MSERLGESVIQTTILFLVFTEVYKTDWRDKKPAYLSNEFLPSIGQGVHTLSIAIVEENVVAVQQSIRLFHWPNCHVNTDLHRQKIIT